MLVSKYHEVLSRQVGEKTSMLYEAENLKAYLETKSAVEFGNQRSTFIHAKMHKCGIISLTPASYGAW